MGGPLGPNIMGGLIYVGGLLGPTFSALKGLLRLRDHTHKLAILRTLLLKLDVPVFFREQRVITTHADVPACMDGCAALPDDDIAGDHFLATK